MSRADATLEYMEQSQSSFFTRDLGHGPVDRVQAVAVRMDRV